jgi:hypothetical protein
MILAALMCAGLFLRSAAARWVQVVIAALGLINCPFSLASGLVLFYLLRPSAAVHFSGRRDVVDLSPNELALLSKDTSETTLTVALLGLVAFGVVATAGLLVWFFHTRP